MYRETRNAHNASDGIMVLMARINPCVLADNNSPLTAADFYLGNTGSATHADRVGPKGGRVVKRGEKGGGARRRIVLIHFHGVRVRSHGETRRILLGPNTRNRAENRVNPVGRIPVSRENHNPG